MAYMHGFVCRKDMGHSDALKGVVGGLAESVVVSWISNSLRNTNLDISYSHYTFNKYDVASYTI